MIRQSALTEILVDTDEQSLSLDGNTLSLENGGSVNLEDYLDNTDDQEISLDGNILTLENGGSVNLEDYLDNTDDQAISLDGNVITLESGGTIDLTDLLANAGVDTDERTIFELRRQHTLTRKWRKCKLGRLPRQYR